MRKVTYSLSISVDGYISGPDGTFNWSEPDPEVFELATNEVRGLGVHLLGKRLYEAMLYWERVDLSTLDEPQLEFAELWNGLPKVVFANSLTSVEGSATRLASAGLAEEIEKLRAEPGEGNIGIGGADLAAQAADLGLIDEYLFRVYPVLVGGGTPYFAHHERFVNLELLETRPFGSGIVYHRYGVKR